MLDAPVLVLDKSYLPVKIITVREAILLLFSENQKALILDPTYQTYSIDEWIEYSLQVSGSVDIPVIRSARINLVVPEVIILPSYQRDLAHAKKLRYSRLGVLRRDKLTCQYCGQIFHKRDLTVDHIIPKSLGGKPSWLNIVTACKPCNWKKSNKTLAQSGMKLLNKPRIPSWRENLDLPAQLQSEIWESLLDK